MTPPAATQWRASKCSFACQTHKTAGCLCWSSSLRIPASSLTTKQQAPSTQIAVQQNGDIIVYVQRNANKFALFFRARHSGAQGNESTTSSWSSSSIPPSLDLASPAARTLKFGPRQGASTFLTL